MNKFKLESFNVFGYELHESKTMGSYVRENGEYIYKLVKGDDEITVKLSTGNYFYHNNFDLPCHSYDVEHVEINGQHTSLCHIENTDFDLYITILDLPYNVNWYSQNVHDYIYHCEGKQEYNCQIQIELDYHELDLSEFNVIECKPKKI